LLPCWLFSLLNICGAQVDDAKREIETLKKQLREKELESRASKCALYLDSRAVARLLC
jgi:hypothetical protein